jgi:ubiquinone biosynthesis protein COQ4
MSDVSIDARRGRVPIRPLKAMRHMRNLIANKEDTGEVFHIIEALNGNALEKNFKSFADSDDGRARLAERRHLPPMLDDRDWIRKLPEGSVGQAYVQFMEREGLTAQGLVDESEMRESSVEIFDDDLKWFGERLRDTHDMFHVLSGYGRDALGEASLLAFSHGQNPGRGIIFISYMGTREIARTVPKDLRIWNCYKEGKRNGAMAEKIARQDIIGLLHEPLDAARARLNIQPPLAYQRALKMYGEMGLDAQELVAAA